MDAGSDLGSAAKGSAIGLEVASSGPVSCCFFILFFSLLRVVLSKLVHTVCALIFAGLIFPIYMDFAFLNSQMLAIVLCVSIDV